MARLRDWLDLGRNTVESLKISDATRFYETEWPETRKMLIADQREAIEGERTRIRRFVRTRSAVLYGLAKRLAPHRRVIFLVSGEKKAPVLQEVLEGHPNPEERPAAGVRPPDGTVEWLVDEAAAQRLKRRFS